MKTFIRIVGYSEIFKSQCKVGWGCGYVHIPKDHPFLVQLLDNEGYFYLQPEDCPEEITLSEWDDDQEYYIIGFDTAHSWNDSRQDEQYVTAQAYKIKALIDAYTTTNAYEYAIKAIERTRETFSKYLL